jgi:hypothetical protein
MFRQVPSISRVPFVTDAIGRTADVLQRHAGHGCVTDTAGVGVFFEYIARGYKYPSWEYVRIESGVPSNECVYKVQEACPRSAIEGCLTYYKKRATRFDANTVVQTQQGLADFYACPEQTRTAPSNDSQP